MSPPRCPVPRTTRSSWFLRLARSTVQRRPKTGADPRPCSDGQPTDVGVRNGTRAEQQKADPPPYVPGMRSMKKYLFLAQFRRGSIHDGVQ
jgi:hypothetical protein